MGRRPGDTVKFEGCWKNTLRRVLLEPYAGERSTRHVPLKVYKRNTSTSPSRKM